MVPFAASMLSGVFVAIIMTPVDVVSTRLFNQGVSSTGRGLMYNNIFDVFIKVFRQEGFAGFYKGIGAHYFRIGPHSILSLVFWDKLVELIQ